MKKSCELCKTTARIHCESDQASLCWDCDAKVHSANFLVSRHSRNLLCRVCQLPTPWSASGSKLEPTFSVCLRCANRRIRGEIDEEAAVEEEEEIDENHVVPRSPPLSESESLSSSEETVSGGEAAVSRKRCRFEDVQRSDERCESLSSHQDVQRLSSDATAVVANAADSISRRTSTPRQKIRRTDPSKVKVSESEVVESLRRIHRVLDLNVKLPELFTLSGGRGTIDLNSSDSG